MIPSQSSCDPPAAGPKAARSSRLPSLFGTIALVIATGGVLLRNLPHRATPFTAVKSASGPPESNSGPTRTVPPERPAFYKTDLEDEGKERSNPAPGAATAAPAPGALRPPQPPSESSRQRVNALVQPGIALNQDEAAQWKGNFEQLLQEGAAAVPAMREFLARNEDLDFGPDGVRVFGYSSVRTALIDGLQQIGGPDAVALMLQTMQTTTDPREIALLAQNLEQQAPDQYRQEAINATRETLAMASQGKLDGRDVGPLFEVLQKLGGAAVVSDLEQAAGNWNYYAAWSLAQLPDGAGIPALIQMAGDPAAPGKGNPGVALEMLARVATQYPEAESTLLDLTRQNKIPARLWPYLASSLTGDAYHYLDMASVGGAAVPRAGDLTTIHINFGNQNLYSTELSGLNSDQIDRQVSFIDRLLSAAKDPAVTEVLQHSRDRLLKRLPQTASITSPAQ